MPIDWVVAGKVALAAGQAFMAHLQGRKDDAERERDRDLILAAIKRMHDEVLDRLATSGATVNRTDGARVDTPDGWWLLRASNTQDVLVARAEAKSEDALERLLAQIDEQLAAFLQAEQGVVHGLAGFGADEAAVAAALDHAGPRLVAGEGTVHDAAAPRVRQELAV